MSRAFKAPLLLLAACLALAARVAQAEPYVAVQQGYKCIACHVNPTGGGLRNDFGILFAENLLAAAPLPEGAPAWSGKVGELLRLGADLRASWTRTDVAHTRSRHAFDVDQLRAYAAASVIPNRLALYLDEGLAPGNARALEAYVRLDAPASGWYLKGGRFYLPFGWRLQDQTAFVREVSGISMTSPDEGVELGLERGDWSAQIDVSNGAANAGAGSGYQLTGQLVRTVTRYRIGGAASFTHADAGDRQVGGLFAGLRTRQIAWLGEVDVVRDEGFPEGARTLVAALGEADWLLRKGHNLKLTAEYFDPDRAVAEDQKTRWSLLYEWTPLPFVQLRAGVRRYRGIPQNDLDNRRLFFLELHGFM
jgi:opacity protein-like surface antigen